MLNKIKRIQRKLRSFTPAMRGIAKISFSQFGEDIIMLSFLERFHVSNITYLDIGANEPITANNTYNFYLRGFSGVLIEPNIDLCNTLKSKRPKDTVLNFGIGNGVEAESDFYMFGKKDSWVNTFSKEEAIHYEKEGFKIEKVIKIPLKNINSVISEHFKGMAPIVISLDVEGLDEMILNSLDFGKYQPLLICVETVIFSMNGEFTKRKTILDLMESKGYFIYADTHVNSIFCSKSEYDKLVDKKK